MSRYYKSAYICIQLPNKLFENNDGQQWTLHAK